MIIMEQEYCSMKEIAEKITSVDRLPTYKETKGLLKFLEEQSDKGSSHRGWFGFCQDNSLFNVHNAEFVDALAGEIKKLDNSPIVEICAGNGKLSYHLRLRGIDIKPTDNHSWRLSDDLVEKLSHQEALEKYNPKIVVASWIPYKSQIGLDALNYPSVSHIISIGENTGSRKQLIEGYDKKEWNMRYFENVEESSICRTDYQDAMSHSRTSLFSRKNSS